MDSKVKIEASDFTGREPDENRYSFDKPRFDSYSGRLAFNPHADNAFQVSVSHPAFKDLGDGRYQGQMTFSMAGPWRIALTITPAGARTAVTKTLDYNVGR